MIFGPNIFLLITLTERSVKIERSVVMATHVCDSSHSWFLDNPFRRIIHNPKKMFGGLINPGDTVIDIGCGPGTFTNELAKLVGEEGRVIAVDMQQEMLDQALLKAERNGLDTRITFHCCTQDGLGLSKKADFILAFWMAHEVPDKDRFFSEISGLLKEKGVFFLTEPRFHVTRQDFEDTVGLAGDAGLRVSGVRSVFFGRTVVMKRA